MGYHLPHFTTTHERIIAVLRSARAQVMTHQSIPLLRSTKTKLPPELKLGRNLKWHLFLSYIWSSGQDQVTVIKRQLQFLCPQANIFLDLDDIQDIGYLERYIEESQCISPFLSKGYFFSVNCNRELTAAISCKKPMAPVHEVDLDHGGVPLDVLCSQCKPEHYHAIFEGPDIIEWHRLKDFQVVSLKLVALAMLRAGLVLEHNESIFIPGEVSSLSELDFKKSVVLYVSPSNPGALAIGQELQEQYDKNFRLTDQLRTGGSGDFGSALSKQIKELKKALSRKEAVSLKKALSLKIAFRRSRSSETLGFTHALLYLTSKTFEGDDGDELASEMHQILKAGVPLLLIHEVDLHRDGCEFAKFFQTTPASLIKAGIYGKMAIAFHRDKQYRAVSYVLTAKALGATPTKSTTKSTKYQIYKMTRRMTLAVSRAVTLLANTSSMGQKDVVPLAQTADTQAQPQAPAPWTATAETPALSTEECVQVSILPDDTTRKSISQVSSGRMARLRRHQSLSATSTTAGKVAVNVIANEKQTDSLKEVVVWSQLSSGWASSSWQPLWSKLASIDTPATAAQSTAT